jgi:hypothetical protein
VRPGVTHALELYLFSSPHHIRVGFGLDHIFIEECRRLSVCKTPPHDQYSFDCVIPILACVLDCACRDKSPWHGHSCVIGDNQQSSSIVIARIRSLGALDHQR